MLSLRGVRLHVGGELLEVLRREILAGEDQDRRAGNHSDRFEFRCRVVGEVRIERDGSGVSAHMPRDESITVPAPRVSRVGMPVVPAAPTTFSMII